MSAIPEILEVETSHQVGSLASVLTTFCQAGFSVDDVRAKSRNPMTTCWELTVTAKSEVTLAEVAARVEKLPIAHVVGLSNRILKRHRGGKIVMRSTEEITSLEVLRDVYTPGVAQVCRAIQQNPEAAREYTYISNTVAVITNGTAILGLGDIGPVAGMPVMEGKAALFQQLAGINGIPILMKCKDVATVVATIEAIAPSFGAIQLEDFAAPECFDIEIELKKRLNIPVMHDDQHGTAVVVLAALLSATKRYDIDLHHSVIGQIGLGAAGIGICSLLIDYGVKHVLGTDLSEMALQRLESLGGRRSTLQGVMAEADIVIATTGAKGLIKPEMVRKGQIILALSNPEPEIEPQVALARGAWCALDGKVANNVLGFPGIFRGALDARATHISREMLLAAAYALSEMGGRDELLPDCLDRTVHARVADAVHAVAR